MKRKARELPGRARGTREEPASRSHVCVSDDSGNLRAIPLMHPSFHTGLGGEWGMFLSSQEIRHGRHTEMPLG